VEGGFKWIRANETRVVETTYTVKGLKPDNVYEFRVAAENKAGVGPASDPTSPIEAKKKISGEAPELLSPLTDTVVVMPEEVTLECEIAEGEPAASLRWFKDDKELHAGQKYQFSYVDDVASLRIPTSEARDSGKYRCEGKNKLGSVETDCKLTVHCAPLLEYDAAPKTLKAGTSLVLLANVVAGMPVPCVRWFLKDVEITSGTTNVTLEGDGKFSRLTIKNVNAVENAGRYTLVAENKVGSATGEFDISVKDKPTAPRKLEVTEQHKEHVVLAWDTPEHDGGSPISKYVVEKADVKRNVYAPAGETDGSTLTFKATKLLEGNDYLFRVAAENSIGQGPWVTIGEPVTAKLAFGPPGPPRNVRVEDLSKTACTIVWEAPKSDGGSKITGYYVEKSTCRSTRFTKVNKEPLSNFSKAVKDLVDGTEYEFRIIAENEAGQSKPSDTTGVFVAKDPYEAPGKPDAPTVTELSKDFATIEWKAPASDGGSPVLHYVVEMKESGDRWKVIDDKVTDKTFTFEKLKEGSSYEFRVTAVNKVGPGVPSSSSQPAKYSEEVKFIKELENINVNQLGVSATFECQLSKEGLKVEWFKDGKKLTRLDDDFEVESDGKTHRLVIKKLTEKHSGTYRAEHLLLTTSAKLSIGVPPVIGDHQYKDKLVLKAQSSAVLEIPFQASPAPDAEWKYNNGRLPDAKRFKSDVAPGLASLTMSKVVKKDAGEYTLTLQNTHGKATLKIKVVVLDVPGPPKNVAVTSVSEREVGLKWEEPDSDGGREIIGYVIEMREASKRVWNRAGSTTAGDKLQFLATPLVSGQQYLFRVAAENDTGVGEWAELSQTVTAKSTIDLPGSPSAPTVLEVFKDRCSLSWKAPDFDGGSPIIGYHVERSTSGKTLRWIRITKEPVPMLSMTSRSW